MCREKGWEVKFKLFSCKDISKVACHKDDLSFAERVNFKLHLFICVKCRNYTASIEQVGKSFTDVIKKRRSISSEKISELEERVLENLKKKNDFE